jgi:sterol desaturase/sphingolipid hydroxylase (fatty acid hydroxylase superfamily)
LDEAYILQTKRALLGIWPGRRTQRLHAGAEHLSGSFRMKLSKPAYFAEFFLFPPLVLFFTVLAFYSSIPPTPVIWALVYGGGLVAWTLLEYLLHRFVFHHAPLLARMHKRHHQRPQELIGTPAWASVLVGSIAIASPSWAVLGFDLATAATAGMVTGYLCYVLIHYAIHHRQPRRESYLYRARRRHALHHYINDRGNFGVTTGVWDHVFGTALNHRYRQNDTR